MANPTGKGGFIDHPENAHRGRLPGQAKNVKKFLQRFDKRRDEIIDKLLQKAAMGDVASIKIALEYGLGKPPMPVDISAPGEIRLRLVYDQPGIPNPPPSET